MVTERLVQVRHGCQCPLSLLGLGFVHSHRGRHPVASREGCLADAASGRLCRCLGRGWGFRYRTHARPHLAEFPRGLSLSCNLRGYSLRLWRHAHARPHGSEVPWFCPLDDLGRVDGYIGSWRYTGPGHPSLPFPLAHLDGPGPVLFHSCSILGCDLCCNDGIIRCHASVGLSLLCEGFHVYIFCRNVRSRGGHRACRQRPPCLLHHVA